MICSKPKLANEIHSTIKTLLKNGYPDDVIPNTITYKCLLFSTKTKFGPEWFLEYLKLPLIFNVSM